MERGASARGAESGRGRGRGARSNNGGGAQSTGPVQEQPVDTAKTEIGAADGGKGKRKHIVALVICTDDHYTDQCPLLRGLKPSGAYCAASDDNGGFFHIQAANEHDIVSTEFSLIAALIKVESGDVSEQLLLTALARIVPVPWRWEAQEEGHKCFIVPFPSREDLTRMVLLAQSRQRIRKVPS
jgi:hypothetical protein